MTLKIEANGPELTLRQPENVGKDAAPSLRDTSAVDGGPDFAAVFQQSVADANRLQVVSTEKAQALARGATDDLHGTMISVKEAEISMKLVGSVRNKLLDAFHELWRINL